MANQEFNTTYSLDPKLAASLRVPSIQYPNNIVPFEVIATTVLNSQTSFTVEQYPQLAEGMNIEELLALHTTHYAALH